MTSFSNPIKLSAMHHQHVASGAAMVEADGWRQPVRYTSADQEAEQVRTAGGLCDVSPAGKLSLQGEEVERLLSNALDGAKMPAVGTVERVGSDGGPRLVARLAYDECLVLTGPTERDSTAQALEAHAAGCAHVVDVTSALAGIGVVGPLGHLLLASVTELDVDPDTFADMSCAQASVAEVHGTLLRLDIGGLLSYELYFPREFGEYMWTALVEAGEHLGVRPVGIEAIASLG